MVAGILILQDGTAQLIGDVDFEKLAPLVSRLGEQLTTAADQQRRTKLIEMLQALDPETREQLVTHKAE